MQQFDIYLCCKLCSDEIYQLVKKVNFSTCYEDLSGMFNKNFRKGKENKCCQSLDSNESYVEKMMSAKNEYKRKQINFGTKSLESEMVNRYMIVLTQIFGNMEAILSFYNFLDKDGPRIQSWMSQGTP